MNQSTAMIKTVLPHSKDRSEYGIDSSLWTCIYWICSTFPVVLWPHRSFFLQVIIDDTIYSLRDSNGASFLVVYSSSTFFFWRWYARWRQTALSIWFADTELYQAVKWSPTLPGRSSSSHLHSTTLMFSLITIVSDGNHVLLWTLKMFVKSVYSHEHCKSSRTLHIFANIENLREVCK